MLWGVSGGTEVARAVFDDSGPGYCPYRVDLAERSGQALAGGVGGAKDLAAKGRHLGAPIRFSTSLTRFGSRLIEKNTVAKVPNSSPGFKGGRQIGAGRPRLGSQKSIVVQWHHDERSV
jgi:hypothetical protein